MYSLYLTCFNLLFGRYRLRISSVLPMLCVSCALQLVNFPVLCSRLAADPGMAAAVCSSTPTWGSVGCWGSLMGLMFGGMIGIPGVIVYCLESRSRRLWLRTSHAQEILAASAISASWVAGLWCGLFVMCVRGGLGWRWCWVRFYLGLNHAGWGGLSGQEDGSGQVRRCVC